MGMRKLSCCDVSKLEDITSVIYLLNDVQDMGTKWLYYFASVIKGRVIMVTKERHLPYDRPILSKVCSLAGTVASFKMDCELGSLWERIYSLALTVQETDKVTNSRFEIYRRAGLFKLKVENEGGKGH